MAAAKRLVRSDVGRRLLAAAIAAYIRLVHATTRWEREMPASTRALLEGGSPCVVAFWHGRMLAMRGAWTDRPERLHLLISGHRDGRLISTALERLGFPSVSGSSRRGGAAALRAMGRELAQGACVGITPDGPKGPRMRVKAGAIKAAQLAGVPIVPVSASARPARLLGSWDRFLVLLPFGRARVLWGEPLAVPRRAGEAELQALAGELERRLIALTEQADRALGRAPVAPDPRPAPGTSQAKGAAGAAPGRDAPPAPAD
ncbi:MAG: lysophospholipid acyltransferase family protein [Tistlia sp.]|uniref:lysophospholipid acyltransferase family protein n=1 Tax=Tistlia sp. TaxID=3057121 RepID=UPI0034A28D18